MLKNTLILPEGDDALAARLLNEAINTLDTVLMLVFGSGTDADTVVARADQLANKTALLGGGNLRKIVWIRAMGPQVRGQLAPILGSSTPLVTVLNFYDRLKAEISPGEPIDPVSLELAFLAGHMP